LAPSLLAAGLGLLGDRLARLVRRRRDLLGPHRLVGPLAVDVGGRRLPAPLARQLQPAQRLRPGLHALAGAAVGEAREDAGRLPPRGEVLGTAGGQHRPPRAQVVDELLGLLGSHVVEELPVDHHHRGEVAGRVALDPLDADLAVRGGLVVAEPRVLAQLVPDLVAAHDGAQGVDADADVVLADRLLLVLRVERHDARHLRGRDAELLRAVAYALRCYVPLL